MELALGIALIVLSVALTVMVLFQSAKDTRLSGTIAGGAETFFGKSKSKKRDKMLSTVTTALSFVFIVLVVVMYIVVA